MRKILLVTVLLTGTFVLATAQSVGINTDGSIPDSTAQLDIKSNTRGVLIPRMSKVERSSIIHPAAGLLVYQTDGSSGFYFNAGDPFFPNWRNLNNSNPSILSLNTKQLALLKWYDVNKKTLVSLGNNPWGMVYDGEYVWVTQTSSSTVAKFRANDGLQVGSYPTQSNPFAMTFDGDYVFVCNQGSGSVTRIRVDGANFGTIATGGNGPSAAVFDGEFVWIANRGSNTVAKINASSFALIGNVPVGNSPTALAFDGKNVWVANNASNSISRIASDGSLGPTINGITSPGGIAFDGEYMWVTNMTTNTITQIRASDGVVIDQYATDHGPEKIVFDGKYIWVGCNNPAYVDRFLVSDPHQPPFRFNMNTGTPLPGMVFDGVYIWVSVPGLNKVVRL